MKRLTKFAPLGLLLGGWALSGFACDQAQVNAGVNAVCVVAQASIATAQANAAVMGKQKAVDKLGVAQTLTATDCPAAIAAVNAAYAAAGVAKPAK